MKPWKNTAWKARALLGRQVDVGTATCGKCGHAVVKGMAWDVGHIIGQDIAPQLAHDPSNWRIEHRHCNRGAGARYGNRKRGIMRPPSPSRQW